jgi:hypothetical protein
MKNTITQQIKDHLEFLGFTTECAEDGKVDTILCLNSSRSNIYLRIGGNFVMLRSSYGIKAVQESVELYRLFNQVNEVAGVTRWYASMDEKDSTTTIVIECYAYGYDKQNFGDLLTKFEDEIRANVMKFYKPEEGK